MRKFRSISHRYQLLIYRSFAAELFIYRHTVYVGYILDQMKSCTYMSRYLMNCGGYFSSSRQAADVSVNFSDAEFDVVYVADHISHSTMRQHSYNAQRSISHVIRRPSS